MSAVRIKYRYSGKWVLMSYRSTYSTFFLKFLTLPQGFGKEERREEQSTRLDTIGYDKRVDGKFWASGLAVVFSRCQLYQSNMR